MYSKLLKYSVGAGLALALAFGVGNCDGLSLPSLSIEASAAEVVDSGSCGENVTYVLDSDGVLTISGSGAMENGNFNMTSPWFDSRYDIKSVVIENGVTSIGEDAFRCCFSLTSITIPDSVTSIGDGAFAYCDSLTSITIPDSVTWIAGSAFEGCTSLTSITIPDSVTSIGDFAFFCCESLTSITIPDSVTSIGLWAFYYCISLTDIYFTGTEEQWNSIEGIEDADIPETTTIHFNNTAPVVPDETPTREEQINDFVERLYTTMLGRNPDEGKQSHVDGLLAGATAAQISEGFVLGAELKAWNISNEEFVRRMYLTFLDREADPEGLAVWTSVLDKGCSYGRMFRDFCNSAEFKIVCDSYGINQGSYAITEPRDINENVTHYCSRMYTKALGRAYDVKGLNIWAEALINGTETPESLAMIFLNGAEFQIWNHSDEVFVDRLYETLFNRPADAEGKQTWLNLLSIGTTRETAIATFVQSQEFILLKQSLGL